MSVLGIEDDPKTYTELQKHSVCCQDLSLHNNQGRKWGQKRVVVFCFQYNNQLINPSPPPLKIPIQIHHTYTHHPFSNFFLFTRCNQKQLFFFVVENEWDRRI